jgi:CubicO group peptidase (beta-lactamase class C family)
MRLMKASSLTLLFLFLYLVLPFQFGGAQTEPDATIPDTIPGRVFADFLRAYNTGDIETMRRFFLTHATQPDPEQRRQSVDKRADWVANIYKGFRNLNLHSIKRATAREIVALCQSTITEAWCEFEIEVDPEPPNGVAIGFTYAARPADQASRGLDQAEMIRDFNGYMEKIVAADMFSGAVLVAKDGKPIFKKGYGWANKSTKVPNGVDTKFSLASMSKMFTGVAITQLAQQGKLSFGDPIGKHLQDYPNKRAAEKVTIHHLLTHTSGLGDYLEKEEFQAARKAAGGRIESPKDYFPFFAADPLLFEPGVRFEYSNAGYVVLGALIEKLSSQSYFDYVTKHIFKPAGMKNTDPRGETGSPAGSAISTAEDLLKFDAALRNHKLLTAKYTDILLTPRVSSAFGGRYAYGFVVRNKDGEGRIVGHDGESAGVNTRLDMYLGSGYTVIVLADYDPPAANNVAAKLQEMIADISNNVF